MILHFDFSILSKNSLATIPSINKLLLISDNIVNHRLFTFVPLSFKPPDIQFPNEKLCPALDAKLNWPGTVWLLNWYPERKDDVQNNTLFNDS